MFARAARLAALSAVLLIAIAGCAAPQGPGSLPPGAGTLTLPSAVGDYIVSKAVCGVAFADKQEQCESNADAVKVVTDAAAKNISAAYGAPAVGQNYALDDYSGLVVVYAVAADSPKLWTAESPESTERLALGHAQEWLEERDGAQCIVRTVSPVLKGGTFDPSDAAIVRCQESGGGLTVMLLSPTGPDVDLWLANTHAAFESVKSGR